MTRFRLALVVVALLTPLGTVSQAQVFGEDAPDLFNAAARVPLSVEFGDENVFAPRLGFRVGGSLYPLPLLLDRDLNIDGFADVTYTLRGGRREFSGERERGALRCGRAALPPDQLRFVFRRHGSR